MQLNPQVVHQQIDNLKLVHPELIEDDEAWLASLESQTDAKELLTSIVRRIEDAKGLVLGTKDRADELKMRRDRFEHRIESLRELAFKVMDAAGITKLELPEATLSIRAGQPQLVGEADARELPDDLCKISRAIDRTAVKDALKTGVTVPGFSLSNAPPSLTLTIRIK